MDADAHWGGTERNRNQKPIPTHEAMRAPSPNAEFRRKQLDHCHISEQAFSPSKGSEIGLKRTLRLEVRDCNSRSSTSAKGEARTELNLPSSELRIDGLVKASTLPSNERASLERGRGKLISSAHL